ncbi:hypothetical protein SUGI_1075890 [Cryptomeria japonica]|nr:hypothetical protein SUGI_1075890 [Cryptomeria japonica]
MGTLQSLELPMELAQVAGTAAGLKWTWNLIVQLHSPAMALFVFRRGSQRFLSEAPKAPQEPNCAEAKKPGETPFFFFMLPKMVLISGSLCQMRFAARLSCSYVVIY